MKDLISITKEEFETAENLLENATNIFGWKGKQPNPGFYRQGGSFIAIFEKPKDNGQIGVALN